MWDGTKRVCVCSALETLFENDDVTRASNASLSDDERLHARWSVESRAEVTRRRDDPRFWITVKHIGTKDAPFRYDEIVAREECERVLARARAAARLRAVGAEPTQELLSEYSRADPIWRQVFNEQVRTWILEGAVDGQAEYHRLYALGFESDGAPGGSSLLIHAAREVRRFQEVPAETLKSGA